MALTREPRLYTTSADYVYQELRHKIITKQLKPGQRLPEVNIAVQMGVSRTPVREALRRLASEGLVIIIPNSGARLASPTKREMEDTFVVRDQLECLAVRLAAGRISERHIRRLEETLLDEERSLQEQNLELYLEVNETFHRIIAEASGNKVLADYVENILARTNVYMVFYDPFLGHGGEGQLSARDHPSLKGHRLLIDALRDRDAERAVEIMCHHLALSSQGLEQPES